MTGYDFIGDIHGHHDVLVALLEKLGYRLNGGAWSHSEGRRVVFLGDYIDRGPKIVETLSVVRGLVEAGAAHAILGNHEFNFLAWNTPWNGAGRDWCRGHTAGRRKQVQETLDQLGGQTAPWLEWMRTLPPSWEGNGARAVHACWSSPDVARLSEVYSTAGGCWTEEFLQKASEPTHILYHAVERALKGPEIALPPEIAYQDKEGTRRRNARIAWWNPPQLGQPIGTQTVPRLPAVTTPLPHADPWPDAEEPEVAKLTFFGHYWMSDAPAPLGPKSVCLDYSVAKGGALCAYRYDGESTASGDKMVWIDTA